jgi:DNA-binding XRE family transcriptional regulator
MSTNKRLKPLLEKEFGPLTFGVFLRAARGSLDLTQTEMAENLGIAKGTLCDIEKGRQLVSPALAVKIARMAGLSEAMAVQACLQDQLKKARISLDVDLVVKKRRKAS